MVNSQGRGHKLGIAYEDIGLVPSSASLYRIYKVELELAKEAPEKTSQVVDQTATGSRAKGPTPIS